MSEAMHVDEALRSKRACKPGIGDAETKKPCVRKARVSCTRDGCDKTFRTKQHMLQHVKAVHNGIKDIECTDPDCNQMFTTNQNMLKHVKAVHDGIKDIECTHPDCDQMFSRSEHMLNHVKAIHDGIRDIECTDPDCDKMFSDQSNMLRHLKAVHEGIKDIECTHPDCEKMFSQKPHMLQHIKTVHEGLKDIECADPDCNQMFSTNQNMQNHYQCWHTKEGQQKKIRKQDRVRQVLEEAYAVDSECHIRYEGGCVPDPDKFYARIDYHVLGITNAIVIVECDEEGHRDYMLTCELSRMEQVHEAIIKANFSMIATKEGEEYALAAEMKPVVFVRFNPDAREVNGEKERIKRADREAMMLEVLQDIGNGTIDLPHPLNIVYIGYDMLDGEPVVCGDPDFAQQMRGCVVLAV